MTFYENGTKYAICGGAVYTMADLRNGKNRATAHTTKKGNFAIVTEF